MKRFKKTMCVLLASVLTVTALPVYQTEVFAQSASQLQAKRKSLSQSTDKALKEIENLKNKRLSVEDEIGVMDKALNSIQQELDEAEKEMDTMKKDLAKAEKNLEEATEKREKQFDVLGKRLVFLQEKGSSGYFEILLEAENFSDLFLRMQYVNDIMVYDKNILDELQETQDTIRKEKDEIEANKKEQEKIIKLCKEKRDSMQEVVDEKLAMIKSYMADESKYQELIAANAKADQGILDMLGQSGGGSNEQYYTGGGSLGWPVPCRSASSSSLSSGFVNRISPITGKRESHSGYDIPAPTGSAIVAAESGRVVYSGWMNGYGYTVVIDHGGGLRTLYGHNSSLTVSKGQTVKRGQTIAKCGSTGWSTGPHCHFSVLRNGAYVNPAPYLGVPNINR